MNANMRLLPLIMVSLLLMGGSLETVTAVSLRGGDVHHDGNPTKQSTSHRQLDESVGFKTLTTSTSNAQLPSQSTVVETTNCESDGQTLRHGAAVYLVGRAHRRGSIFAECVNGVLSCYEDSGLMDLPTASFRTITCDSVTITQRQRDLDLEDQRSAM